MKLLAELDTTKVEWDEALDDFEGVHAREEVSKLSFELNAMRAKAATLQGQVSNLGTKEVELLAKLEALRVELEAKAATLQAELEAP
ncbi:hypothetical protein ACLOJK_006137 [Asimina triloba]